MKKQSLFLCAAALALGLMADSACACWDNTDEIITKLQELDLDTEQLQAIFALRQQHEATIERAHREGLGCRVHEDDETVFEKASIGVLDDGQFNAYKGRARTEAESLTYEIYLLRCEISRLKTEIATRRTAAAPAAPAQGVSTVGARKSCCPSSATSAEKAAVESKESDECEGNASEGCESKPSGCSKEATPCEETAPRQ